MSGIRLSGEVTSEQQSYSHSLRQTTGKLAHEHTNTAECDSVEFLQNGTEPVTPELTEGMNIKNKEAADFAKCLHWEP